jgi:hypothetical protein
MYLLNSRYKNRNLEKGQIKSVFVKPIIKKGLIFSIHTSRYCILYLEMLN